MTAPRDIDRMLDSWMNDGPTIVADRVIAAALTELPTTKQRGSRWALRRYFTMTALDPPMTPPWRRSLPLLAAAALLIAIVGVMLVPRVLQIGDGPGLSGGVPFASERYGYELTLPAEWTTNEVPGTWRFGSVAMPAFPGTDEFTSPDSDLANAHLYIWATEAPAGTTLASFLESWDEQTLTGLECPAAPTYEATVIDGVAGRLSSVHCSANGIPLNLRETVVVTDGMVFVMAMDTDPAEATDPEMDDLYRSVMDTFRFTD